ncbi:shikimate dehydrogenase [Staphylococcus sp. 17KM0847]|uniref:shikimate dehydrogenase n=1 Tax=Staphylococcus sp. 17KM0847 TaxID=2583989 RepID=UPI0015DD04D0|nr:shikimate dehydrogenase [Staphylococcus sp. 17KM0847]QLK86025.1 shikimate dehydrogenase [Staphylococcus sp. 17KM0847]
MKFAVIGNPISHSLSPLMHHENFKALKLNAQYEALNIPPEHFHHIRDIIQAHALDGFNVTIPHKERIIPYLDALSPEAEAIGAVNTVVVSDNQWVGHNTDGIGFVKGLEQRYGNLDNARILIIGAGGASKGIAYTLTQKARYPIAVVNRTMSRFDDWQFDIEKHHLSELEQIAGQFDIIINTTPVGMNNVEESVGVLNALKEDVWVCDIIYIPAQTAFLKQAADQGYQTYNGLDMFVYQGAESFRIWTGQEANIEAMRQIVEHRLYQ